jgi:hypothetical protein
MKNGDRLMNRLVLATSGEAPRGLGALVWALGFAATMAVTGCDQGKEGDRCNPDLSHDECNSGLTCQQPSTCAENYCCPTPASSSSNPYCNGQGCPQAADAGQEEDDASGE